MIMSSLGIISKPYCIMKTNKLFAVAALLPVLFSCAKEEIRTNDNLSGDGQKYDFTITVSGDEDSITKASLSDETGIFWVGGGKAGIVKKDGENTVRYESNALTDDDIYKYGEGEGPKYNQASFAFTETYAGEYKFFYPYHDQATLDKIPFWVAPNQTTKVGESADCFALVSNDMVSLTSEKHDIAAETKYTVVGSYIRFTVYGKDDETVKYIITKGADRTVSGRYFVNGNENANALLEGETDLKGETITLTVEGDCKTTADAATAKGLYVAVLPESSQNTYTVITDKGFYSFASAEEKTFKFGAIKNIPLNLTSTKAARTPKSLYVVGDATTAGWHAAKAIALNKVENENKYKIENIPLLTGGEGFKFLTKLDDWNNTFVNAGDNKLAYYVNIPDGKDTKFTVDKNGCYDIVVDFDAFTVTTTFKVAFPEVRSHKQEKKYEMLPTGNDGEFKAAAFLGWGGGYHDFYIYEGDKTYHESDFRGIYSFSKDNNYTYTGSVTLDNSTDKGWWIADDNYQTPRYYDITLNKNKNTVTVKFAQGKNFWLIGVNNTWARNDNYKATVNAEGIAEWTVDVNTSTEGWDCKFKICGEYTLGETGDDFFKGEWYYAVGESYPFNWSWEGGNNYSKDFDVQVFIDSAKIWRFNESGKFKITFDTKNLKIKVEKL